ncbi:hypothetical protein BAE46_14025 [Glaciecola punicea]|uniref:HD domain-containing protein n=1 Tax=Glaciecola punicea TaxID=56804 RepID=UPI00087270F3|nr:HD domain-containing protein [Glaciecola punicea]OFA29694.1 hypothetical protein BAE46_14025 [Glaciecola punicea]
MKQSNKLASALQMATFAHRDQKRKFDGDAYICHLLEVIIILRRIGIYDEDTLVAGLLHDAIEDTFISPNMLSESMGSNVANIVNELTDDKALAKDLRNQATLKLAPTLSKSAVNIKLADLLSNMLAIPTSWNENTVEKYLVKCSLLINIIETQNVNACPAFLQLVKYALESQTTGSPFFFDFYENADKGLLYWSLSRQRFIVINEEGGTLMAGTEFDTPLNDLFQCQLLHSLKLNGDKCQSINVTQVFSEQSEDYVLAEEQIVNDCMQVTILTRSSVSRQGEGA